MSEHTITEFLEARIAEDEAGAEIHWRKTPDFWLRVSKVTHSSGGKVSVTLREGGTESLNRDEYNAKYCDPTPSARVLAECAAKRAIIAAHPVVDDVVEVSTRIKHGFACETCFSYGDIVEDNGYCDTLRALAAVYADHPDYRQEWAL